MLIELAASAELFHTANGTAFADLMIDGPLALGLRQSPGNSGASATTGTGGCEPAKSLQIEAAVLLGDAQENSALRRSELGLGFERIKGRSERLTEFPSSSTS